MDTGGATGLFVLVAVGAAAVYGLYWVIRLAVYHGIRDADRYGRVWTRDGDASETPGGRA
ncbi:hypothetical protein IEZ26_14740 [Nocardioides cavernae]|uniref:DUF4234 domain-containing protein n=1 Tax=Nocardioides cavernae TaxID=1921566 RepID=A0ABR8NCL8_9ACTN|nr:hypothetical protein [Nocardioides cavernae]MBD3925888.1 hypothetical protein [Nocardioides cavernae]MBM7513473.1 hypothetical protein [Nocardioides cavernae]